MLRALVRNLTRPRTAAASPAPAATPLRLHIGGQIPHRDWKIVDAAPGPHVDYLRPCTDLSIFANDSVREIYASHVIEHLGYRQELSTALREFHRVLEPGGTLRASVPDLTRLCALFLDPALGPAERFHVMRMMYGGQLDEFDFHRVGLTEEFFAGFLADAGFTGIARVQRHGLFEDSSELVFNGEPVSLNVTARKPG